MSYETVLYDVDGAIATITLNRPQRLNTIVPPMPDEIEAAVHEAIADAQVKVIVLRGAGRSFCAGFDFARRLSPLGRAADDRRRVGPGQGLRRGDGAEPRLGAEVHGAVALAQAGDRAGARLVRGRRLGHGTVRRPRDRVRGRAHRHVLLAHVGLLPDGHVAVPAGADQGQGTCADRKTAVRPGSGRGGIDQRGGTVRAAASPRCASAPSSWPRSRCRSCRR